MRKRQIWQEEQIKRQMKRRLDNVSGEVEALQKKYNELNDSHPALDGGVDNIRKTYRCVRRPI